MTDAQGFTEPQRAGLEARIADQDRTLASMHSVEAALGAAAARRERPWRDDVLAALAELEAVTTEEYHNADQPDSLLSDLKRSQPRVRNRVRGVRLQYRQLLDAIISLRQELTNAEDATPDVADIRQRITWLLTALRHQRARESDLIYEAYFDAFKSDLGAARRPND